MPGVKKFCEMVFTKLDGSPSDVGVVSARLVPGVGDFQVFDLLKRPKEWGKMCGKSSYAEQRNVYHKNENTKCALLKTQLMCSAQSNNSEATCLALTQLAFVTSKCLARCARQLPSRRKQTANSGHSTRA